MGRGIFQKGSNVQAHEDQARRLPPRHACGDDKLALAYLSAGRLREALPLCEQALKLENAKLGRGRSETLIAMNNLALVYRNVGRVDEALPLFEETLKLKTAVSGPDDPNTFLTMNNLALADRDAGRRSEALPLLEKTQSW